VRASGARKSAGVSHFGAITGGNFAAASTAGAHAYALSYHRRDDRNASAPYFTAPHSTMDRARLPPQPISIYPHMTAACVRQRERERESQTHTRCERERRRMGRDADGWDPTALWRTGSFSSPLISCRGGRLCVCICNTSEPLCSAFVPR
jgi:hypothetical protein